MLGMFFLQCIFVFYAYGISKILIDEGIFWPSSAKLLPLSGKSASRATSRPAVRRVLLPSIGLTLVAFVLYYALHYRLLSSQSLTHIDFYFVLLANAIVILWVIAGYLLRKKTPVKLHKGIAAGALLGGFACMFFVTFKQLNPPEWYTDQATLETVAPVFTSHLQSSGAWQPIFLPVFPEQEQSNREDTADLQSTSPVRYFSDTDNDYIETRGPNGSLRLSTKPVPKSVSALRRMRKASEITEPQIQALQKAGYIVPQTFEALDGSGEHQIFMPTEDMLALYHPAKGLRFADLALHAVTGWRYAEPPAQRHNVRLMQNRVVTQKVFHRQRRDAARDFQLQWSVPRHAAVAAGHDMQNAFPVIGNVMRGAQKDSHVARISSNQQGEIRISGITRWGQTEPSPTSRYLQAMSSSESRDHALGAQMSETSQRLEAERLSKTADGNVHEMHNALIVYLAKHAGFVILPDELPERLRKVMDAAPEHGRQPDEPDGSYRIRQEAFVPEQYEKVKDSKEYETQQRRHLLEDAREAFSSLNRLDQPLTGESLDREALAPPPSFDSDNPSMRRFALFGANEISIATDPFIPPTPDGWTYCQVRFTYNIRQKAPWADNAGVQEYFPRIKKLLDGAGTRECFWLVRFKNLITRDKPGTPATVYEVVYFQELASGM